MAAASRPLIPAIDLLKIRKGSSPFYPAGFLRSYTDVRGIQNRLLLSMVTSFLNFGGIDSTCLQNPCNCWPINLAWRLVM